MNNELFFEGKKFISAKRASLITGYTSDYIGQMCRAGMLDCRVIGRSWFVNEKSLEEHKKIASAKPRGAIRFPTKSEHTVPPNPEEDYAFAKGVLIHSVPILTIMILLIVITANTKNWAGAALKFVSESKNIEVFLDDFRNSAQNYGREAEIVFNSIIVSDEDSLIASSGFIGEAVTNLRNSLGSFAIKINGYLARVFEFKFRKNILVIDDQDSARKKIDALTADKDKIGITVLSGLTADNEQVKNYIRNSFSDETEIIPDPSGDSGVIRPIFKNKKDQDYLFVLVPLREKNGQLK